MLIERTLFVACSSPASKTALIRAEEGGGGGGGGGRVAIPEQFADKSLTNDPIMPVSLMWGSGPPFSRVFSLSSTVNHTQTIATFGNAPLAALCDSLCACFFRSQLLGR